ncbi:MAG: phage virion morphogenesis protein [Burkholderiaceae bacterium]
MSNLVSIEVTGNRELRESLVEALRRLEHPTDLMAALGGKLESNIEGRFDSKTDPSGLPWAPLAASTKAAYARADTVRKGRSAGEVRKRGSLLERTRQMRDSLFSNTGDDFVEIGMSRLSDNGNWNIALLHETGTERMPRRGIFLADPDAGTLGARDEADLDAAIVAFLDDVFGA